MQCRRDDSKEDRCCYQVPYWLYSGFKTQIKFRLQLVQKQRPIRNSVGFILAVFASSSWPPLTSEGHEVTFASHFLHGTYLPLACCFGCFFFFFCLPQVVRRMKDLGLSRGESPCIILYHPVFCKIVLFN